MPTKKRTVIYELHINYEKIVENVERLLTFRTETDVLISLNGYVITIA